MSFGLSKIGTLEKPKARKWLAGEGSWGWTERKIGNLITGIKK